jgi:hypothetical protein
MYDVSQNQLMARLSDIWNASTDTPAALIVLVRNGSDISDQIRQITQELSVDFIRLNLGQVVTPEQHLLFTRDKPRIVAILGIDRLTPSERNALARLVYNGPRTLPVILCPVESEEACKIIGALTTLSDIEDDQTRRATLLANSTELQTRTVASLGGAIR